MSVKTASLGTTERAPSLPAQDGYHPAMENLPPDFARVRELSPRRNTTSATDIPQLVDEQLRHFSIDPAIGVRAPHGRLCRAIFTTATRQRTSCGTSRCANSPTSTSATAWRASTPSASSASSSPRSSTRCNNPLRKTYQSLLHDPTQSAIKGPYPIFDNVTALFSATPVITRTATYMYACTEWVEDAFKGREPLLEIYSRLLNPTSISLANHIVDLEAGPLAGEYLAWNFNSGMAAIDATLANLVGYHDVVLSSRNVYGGTYQLLHDWYGKKSNLDVAIEWFDGFTVEDFSRALAGDARRSTAIAWAAGAASTSSSNRPAIRMATCSTCRPSAAPRTNSA